tara:strand:+ start:875 stop:1075 length:201 start_codon:yes stop_codon:yes gene_type:complete
MKLDIKTLVALISAINEVVELDEWTLEELANQLDTDTYEIIEIFNEASELHQEYTEISIDNDDDIF